MAYSVEQREDGVYSITTSTRYNAQGEPLTGTQMQLISQLSATQESKSISIDARGRKVAEWGSAIQPACFGYDEADRMITLTTFHSITSFGVPSRMRGCLIRLRCYML